MSKRNITYVKPEEPNFLKKLKQQIGYKEGPTVDTKVGYVRPENTAFSLTIHVSVIQREDLGPVDDDEYREDAEDELPTVVVLNSGDLSAEEAAKEKQRLELGKERDNIVMYMYIFRRYSLKS